LDKFFFFKYVCTADGEGGKKRSKKEARTKQTTRWFRGRERERKTKLLFLLSSKGPASAPSSPGSGRALERLHEALQRPGAAHLLQGLRREHLAQVLLHLRHLLRVRASPGSQALAHRLHYPSLPLGADDRRPHSAVLADQLSDFVGKAAGALRDAPDAGLGVEDLGVGGVELLCGI